MKMGKEKQGYRNTVRRMCGWKSVLEMMRSYRCQSGARLGDQDFLARKNNGGRYLGGLRAVRMAEVNT